MKLLLALFFAMAASAAAQQLVRCPLSGKSGEAQGDLYGRGVRGLLLAHGGRFHKESWRPQAEVLAKDGFLVLSVTFRGDGQNADGSPGSSGTDEANAQDVLAGVACLRQHGATSVSAVGGSMGGYAIGLADVQSPGAFDRMVFLASSVATPEKLTGRKLILVARDDTSGDGLRLPGIRRSYDSARSPKKLIVVPGSAHAQFLFTTAEGPRVLREIEHFLLAP